MARIYNAHDAQRRKLDRFDRDRLEQFSEAPALEIDLPPPLAPGDVSRAVLDRGELRESLLAELRAETQKAVEQAFQEGHQRGVEAGRREFLDSTAKAAEMLEQAARAMAEARDQFLNTLEPQILDLVILVCRKVLAREVTCSEDLLRNTVRRALTKLADQQKLVVRVHPDDHEALHKHRVALLEEFRGVEELKVLPDAEVTAGGCIVESPTLQVDARLEVLLENVLESLRD